MLSKIMLPDNRWDEDDYGWDYEIDGFEYSVQDILWEGSQHEEEREIYALGEMDYFGSDICLTRSTQIMRNGLSRKNLLRRNQHIMLIDRVESLGWKYSINSQTFGFRGGKIGIDLLSFYKGRLFTRLSANLEMDEGLIDAIEKSKAKRNRKRKRFGII